jgi:hypothetical protein
MKINYKFALACFKMLSLQTLFAVPVQIMIQISGIKPDMSYTRPIGDDFRT